ncbi:MAG: MarR family transcriptional regulator [Ruminococcus sp.]|nr:MarR family transcriptional regulator [Ruminococcus sp.]
MDHSEYDALKLENQMCFPLYAAAREVTKLYRPYLNALNLTYTQYITMLVLWEQVSCSVKELGQQLYLDSGTLTPVLKSLEQKGFVRRSRSAADERVLTISTTPAGAALREVAKSVPQKIGGCIRLTPEEAQTLHRLLYKVLDAHS